ncbi:MAG: 16S rRNA (guanine(527)-N(7))-methyltransferase RsmG [Chitinophagales bacterium]
MEIILKYFSDFTPTQADQLSALEGLYKEWNEKINVISRKDIDSLYEKHVLHSLSIAVVFDFHPGTEILDLGTGGGFPGIPLAIYFPEVKFHLVDSIAKKLKVVDAITDSLGLSNITTQHSRVEEIRNGKFDFVVSRAVAPLKDLWNWSSPLLKKTQKSSGLPFPDQRPKTSNSRLTTNDSRLTTHDSELPTPDSRLQTHLPGLISLKGGDLAEEIQQSGLRPYVTNIHDIFPEEYFTEKYILYAPL